ncbi:McrC family protein [Clostridium sp. J1101437_171009_A5]|uniref:McrC family protein n=1 Tax=Clostridium sp. J1101437_171009_A5 TaxID=2787098 RepID=UPI00256FD5BB|nr:McrC family protein [Clostridium sp. J1101437_171009_A5]
MKQYTIREYMGFTRNGPPRAGLISLPEHAFDQLEQFILSNREEGSGTQPLELMSLSAKPGVGKVITAKNYVGVITTRDGTEIEILPKLTIEGDDSDQAVRKVFLTMLRTVQEAPFKTFRTAHLNTSRMRLLDLFVRMFLDEAHRLIQRGLKSDYTARQDNEPCVRGKIVFSEHIRKNLLHRERIFVEYDVFSVDCPENRLVKSTAVYLQRHATDLQNRKDLRIVLSVMDQVPVSKHVEQDFLRCGQSRSMADYRRLLELCRVFLQGKSFTAFSGGEAALALLFPMERVFESYVAAVLRRHLDFRQYRVHVQAKGKYLFELPRKQFALRPDLVIEDLDSGERTILDTKWKLLSPQWRNYGISQADMYQMYAYQKEYAAKQVVLLYPDCEAMAGQKSSLCYSSPSGSLVIVQTLRLDSPIAMAEAVKELLDVASQPSK